MKTLLALTAVGEAVTGLVLLVYPPIVAWLLFAAEVTGVEVVMSRVAGAALLAIGVVCWPARNDPGGAAQLGLLVLPGLQWVGVHGWRPYLSMRRA